MKDADFDFWIKNNLNVLFKGKHGVGKTARVIEAFERNKLNWLYFSASTLDPWVDFIGVPKETEDPKTGKKYLDLVRPKCFVEDEVEAIFLDEGNRAPKKVRNAIMELIQFKSINGKKFNNLKIVWTAINPEEQEDDEESYDVEVLDPAQKDRFQIQVEIPYKPDRPYFLKTHGEEGTYAIDWWDECSPQAKNAVSPRRLDYAVSVHKMGGNLRHVLPSCANVSKFIQELSKGSFRKKLEEVVSNANPEALKKFIDNPNNFSNCIGQIVKKDELIEVFLPYMSEEKVSSIASKDDRLLRYLDSNLEKNKATVEALVDSNFFKKKHNKKYQNLFSFATQRKTEAKASGFKNLRFKQRFSLPRKERTFHQISANFGGATTVSGLMNFDKIKNVRGGVAATGMEGFMNLGTAYREIVFNTINTLAKGPNGIECWSVKELEFCLNLLCSIINRSSSLRISSNGNFKGLNSLFGALVANHASRSRGTAGSCLKKIKISSKVSDFIEDNSELFN
jgi:hypothetical protein